MKMNMFAATLLLSLTVAEQASAQLHDPTQPPGYQSQENNKASGYQLNSLQLSDSKQIALINDQFVEVGDVVDGANVVSIRDNEVDLEKSGRTITLHLF